jgi:hypothetical protein
VHVLLFHVELVHHLFVTCEFVKHVWHNIFRLLIKVTVNKASKFALHVCICHTLGIGKGSIRFDSDLTSDCVVILEVHQ